MQINKCVKCGREWCQRGEKSKQCPGCRTTNWDGHRASNNQYDFALIEIGQVRFYPWNSQPHLNFRINAALTAFCHRSGKRFERKPTGTGMEITRVL